MSFAQLTSGLYKEDRLQGLHDLGNEEVGLDERNIKTQNQFGRHWEHRFAKTVECWQISETSW